MNMNKISGIILFALLNLIFATEAQTPSKIAQWNQEMQELRSLLSELLPDLFSDKRFNSPENFKRIETNVKKLADLTHGMPDMNSPNSNTHHRLFRTAAFLLFPAFLGTKF